MKWTACIAPVLALVLSFTALAQSHEAEKSKENERTVTTTTYCPLELMIAGPDMWEYYCEECLAAGEPEECCTYNQASDIESHEIDSRCANCPGADPEGCTDPITFAFAPKRRGQEHGHGRQELGHVFGAAARTRGTQGVPPRRQTPPGQPALKPGHSGSGQKADDFVLCSRFARHLEGSDFVAVVEAAGRKRYFRLFKIRFAPPDFRPPTELYVGRELKDGVAPGAGGLIGDQTPKHATLKSSTTDFTHTINVTNERDYRVVSRGPLRAANQEQ
ncbi:MAG: hypothetical protein KY476_24390 [Planctomycetes bacterium]|nr:hypothetical protein [Planctomycetota bacterium]